MDSGSENRISGLASSVLSIAFFFLFIWGETVGIVHAFRQHGTGDGWGAIFVPPFAWWRGAEFFFHEGETEIENSTSVEEWPEASPEELDIISRISGKAVNEPLTEDDLAEYARAAKMYSQRVGRPLKSEEVEQLKKFMEIPYEYNRELGRCLLMSFDGKQPFVSTKLEQLRRKMEELGVTREGKLETDMRMIVSAAHGTEYTGEFGQRYHPVERGNILTGLQLTEVMKSNMEKLAVVLEGLTQDK